MPDTLFPEACPHKNSRNDEKKRHSETKEENIQKLKHGMLIGAKDVGIGQSFVRMTEANEDDTYPSGIIYPRVSVPG